MVLHRVYPYIKDSSLGLVLTTFAYKPKKKMPD
jgi:hypothetical protein